MPIARDPRNDRRRRVLRDYTEDADGSSTARTKKNRNTASADETPLPRRGAGYSQDVRKACGQRLVQLIPIRRRSFFGVVVASLLVPALLLTAHYMIYVSGQWAWYGHPLAFALDAGHPRSIAAWATSQLWILCLAATVLTFQLRRHKLDDYGGEYRLWFWLVLTCLLGSLEASTGISELFAMALDRWSQINLGWSGPAVVKSTIAVLVGMLGLRLCTELKSVPSSVLFMLVGLLGWASSAALGQPELLLNMTPQLRHFLRAALWLSGLTAIWLAAVSYLRSVYMEAQQRFLLRGHLAAAANSIPLRQRLRESLPSMPRFRRDSNEVMSGKSTKSPPPEIASNSRRWGIPFLGWRKKEDVETDASGVSVKPKPKQSSPTRSSDQGQEISGDSERSHSRVEAVPQRKEEAPHPTRGRSPQSEDSSNEPVRRGLGGFLRRSGAEPRKLAEKAAPAKPQSAGDKEERKGRLFSWLRRPKDDGEAEEYRKIQTDQDDGRDRSAAGVAAKRKSAEPNASPRKSWIPKMPRVRLPKVPRPSLRGITSRIKLPKLPSLRLAPPDEEQYEPSDSVRRPTGTLNTVDSGRPLPGTNSSNSASRDSDDSAARPMSKAERKRLRRLQQQDRAA